MPRDTIVYTTPPFIATEMETTTSLDRTSTSLDRTSTFTKPTDVVSVIPTTEVTTHASIPFEGQTFSFTEEFLAKHHAVKITVASNKKAFVKYFRDAEEEGLITMLEGEYIENYKYYSDRLDDGRLGIGNDYMESPIVICIPIGKYENLKGKTLCIQGETYRDATGKMNTASAVYTLNFDYEAYYSQAPMQMKNEFLHQVLTAYFDGDYSHHDLLDIEILYIDYKSFDMESKTYLSPSIMLGYSKGSGEWITETYYYRDLFKDSVPAPSLMPSELLEDLAYFPSLQSVLLRDMEGDEKFDEIEKTLLPYKVTEDIWSE